MLWGTRQPRTYRQGVNRLSERLTVLTPLQLVRYICHSSPPLHLSTRCLPYHRGHVSTYCLFFLHTSYYPYMEPVRRTKRFCADLPFRTLLWDRSREPRGPLQFYVRLVCNWTTVKHRCLEQGRSKSGTVISVILQAVDSILGGVLLFLQTVAGLAFAVQDHH